jgi:hypothetical protein
VNREKLGACWRDSHEFKAVAPGVIGEEAADAWEGVVVADFDTGSKERSVQAVEIVGDEREVSFLGGTEVALDADVQLLRATLKPAAATGAKRSGFFDFREAEESSVEFAGGGLAALGSGNLNVINACDV